MTNEQARTSIRIVGLCGSLREGSYTRRVVEIALEGAARSGAETELIDLGDYELSFCDGRDDESTYPEGVSRLRGKVRQAHGVILGSPEYHGSVSGVLKNALDLMGFDEFEGKMIGLVGVSGGAFGAPGAFQALRTIGRAVHAWVVPEQVAVAEAWKMFDEGGKLKDSEVEKRLRAVGEQVVRFSFLHVSDQAREFLEAWEGAAPNPGG